MEKKTLFRNPMAFGDGYTDAVRVITHEMWELGNIDIPAYVNNTYCGGKDALLLDAIRHVEGDLVPDEYEEEDIYNIACYIIDILEKKFGVRITDVLWLADRDTVVDIYEGTDENIEEYECSDIVVSDLGGDGILYGYVGEPRKIN